MALESLVPLLVFAVVATITPGGATTLATASGARFGFRRSLPLIAGMVSGLTALSAATAAGLAGLLLAIPSLQLALKAAGSAYLLWLAWKIAGSGAPGIGPGGAAPTGFVGGLVLLAVNPKAWSMAFGAAASFSALAAEPWRLAALLASALGLSASVALTLWCLAGLVLARRLRTERQWRAVNGALGLLLATSAIPIWMD